MDTLASSEPSIGLMYLSMNDMQAIRSLVDTLRIPSLDARVRLNKNEKNERFHTVYIRMRY